MAKRTLSAHELDAQTAVELPNRDMMALVVIVAPINLELEDVEVNVQACAALFSVQSPVQCDQN